MIYRYRPPVFPVDPDASDARQMESEPSDVVFRRGAMLGRYADLFRELTRAFDCAPLGLWPRIRDLAPTIAQSIDDTDRDAEELAIAYVAGLVQVAEFERALQVHRDAWIRGAEIVTRATPPFPSREACSQCGTTTMTTAVRDDQGFLRCASCLAGRSEVLGVARDPK